MILLEMQNTKLGGFRTLYCPRALEAQVFYRAPQLRQKKPRYSKRDHDVVAVLNATGPWALRAAFKKFSRDFGPLRTSWIGAWTINDTNVMVYPVGTW